MGVGAALTSSRRDAFAVSAVALTAATNAGYGAANRVDRKAAVGRQRQLETFGCSRSAGNLSRSSGGACERPLSRTPISLTAPAKVKFQSRPVVRPEDRRRPLWVADSTGRCNTLITA